MIPEYTVLRCILILLVVYGHCTMMGYGLTGIWGGYSFDFGLRSVGDSSVVLLCAQFSQKFVYQFHMAAFIALSGALFRHSLARGRYPSFGALFKDKGLKLMVPYFVITLFYEFPIKYFTGYFNHISMHIRDATFWGLLMLRGNNYLWYLEALFLIFLFVYLLEKYVKVGYFAKFAIMLAVFLLRLVISIPLGKYFSLVYPAMENGLWFYLGFLFAPHRESCNAVILKHRLVPWMALVVLLGTTVLKMISEGPAQRIVLGTSVGQFLLLFSTLLGMYMVYAFALMLSQSARVRTSRIVQTISRDGLGIYIYSEPLNGLITFLAVSIFGVGLLAHTPSSLLLILVRFFGTLLVPIGICWVLRKMHVKYLV